jgi:NAD(P)-dependent dehydrogenase (short-subunit alcohol dehydrogenase family)
MMSSSSVAGDMADPGIATRVAAAHREKFESVDALILNAGIGTAGKIDSFPMRRSDKTVAAHLRAPLALLQATLPLLRRAAADKPDNGAKVIALSSITGVHGQQAWQPTARPKRRSSRWWRRSTPKNPVLVFQRLLSLLGMSTPTWRHGPTTASPPTP